jgi:hypothetical protein
MRVVVAAVGVLLATAAVAAAEPGETITARAQVLDGATLKLDG